MSAARSAASIASIVFLFTDAGCTQPREPVATKQAALVAPEAPDCPAPTERRGPQCVLRADVVLTRTLRLPSGTTLNCQGHLLRPAVVGTLDDPRTSALEFKRSEPELAIFVEGGRDTTIQACRIEGFDHGILLLGSKLPAGATTSQSSVATNQISGNFIDVRTTGIRLMKADNTLVNGNHVTYASERGRGIIIDMDSDGNRIVGNTVVSTDAASTGDVRQLPGGAFVRAQTPIMDNEIHTLLSSRPLQTFLVDSHLAKEERDLVQVAVGIFEPAEFEDATRTEDNLIEGNTVLDQGPGSSCTREPGISCRVQADCPAGLGPCLLKQNSGIGFNVRASFNVVRGNSLGGTGTMERGVSFAGNDALTTLPAFFPGRCAGDSTRMCLDLTDCNVEDYDPPAGVGPCLGALPITFNGNSIGLVAEDNQLRGAYQAGALFALATDGFTFRRNLVEGGPAMVSGVRLEDSAINGTVQRNVSRGGANGLFLAQPLSGTLSVTVALNDFTGYAAAIRTTNDYTAPTSLGGNYWGVPCPGLDPTLVKFENGAVNGVVTSASYGVPVAQTPDALLPPLCL